MDTLILFSNLIPGLFILLFVVNGWVNGILYSLLTLVQFFGSYYITRIVSNLITDTLLKIPIVRSKVLNLAVEYSGALKQIPGFNIILDAGIINTSIEGIARWLVYIVVFIIVFFLLMIIFTTIIRLTLNFNKIPVLGIVNRLTGAVFGFVYGLLITLLLIYIFSFIFSILGKTEIAQGLLNSWLPVLFRNLIK